MKQWWSLIFDETRALIPRSWQASLSVDILLMLATCLVHFSELLSSPTLLSSPAPLSSFRLSPVLSWLLFPPASTLSSHQLQLTDLWPNTVDLRIQTSIPHLLPTETQPPKNGILLNGLIRKLLCIWGKMPWCWWHLNSCRCHCSIWRHIILPFISCFKPDSAQWEATQLRRKLSTYIRTVSQTLHGFNDIVPQGWCKKIVLKILKVNLARNFEIGWKIVLTFLVHSYSCSGYPLTLRNNSAG